MTMTAEKRTFKSLVDEVAQQLVATEHHSGASFIRTPLLYPSGATVVVRIEEGNWRYFVSDWGLGYQESELYGADSYYSRHARIVAESAGVGFDNQSFFITEAAREQLAGAVIAIANCSQEASVRAADALAEKTFEDSKDRLYRRLVSIFEVNTTERIVVKNAKVIGHSSTEWSVATIVTPPGAGKSTIFEPVTKHHSSVAHASMKFHDIALLEAAPARVAVVRKKLEFGTFLSVLAQAAQVVDEEVSDDTIIGLAA